MPLQLTGTEAQDGRIIISLRDDAGAEHIVSLPTIEAASLIGALRASLEEAIGQPAANSMALPGMVRVQLVETETEVFFHVYMSERMSHDYPVAKNTTLAQDLKFLLIALRPGIWQGQHIHHAIMKRASIKLPTFSGVSLPLIGLKSFPRHANIFLS